MKKLLLTVLATCVLLIPVSASATTINFQTDNSNDDLIFGGSGAASVYPSNLVVSASGTFVPGVNVTRMDILLDDMVHGNPDDLDILLVSPGGLFRILLLSDAGGSNDLGVSTPCDVRFSTTATNTEFYSDAGPIICNQEWNPTNYGAGDAFPAPAPLGPYTTGFGSLNVFLGNSGNIFGAWSLYVFDDSSDAGDGNSAGGQGGIGMRDFRLSFHYDEPAVVPEPASLFLLGSGLVLVARRRHRRRTSRS